jgi:hypothetical protein
VATVYSGIWFTVVYGLLFHTVYSGMWFAVVYGYDCGIRFIVVHDLHLSNTRISRLCVYNHSYIRDSTTHCVLHNARFLIT